MSLQSTGGLSKPSQAEEGHESPLCHITPLGNAARPSSCHQLMPRGSAPQEPFCLLELGNFLPADLCHDAPLRSGEERHIVTPWETLEAVLEEHDIFLLPCGWSNLDRRDLCVGEENCCHSRAACNWCLFPNEENYCNH